MKHLFRHIIPLIVAMVGVTGCNIWSDYDPNGILSELSISVSVSDMPGGVSTKALNVNPDDYVGAMHDGEKIQTLRILIVRKDGTIEHNRYMDFYGAIQRSYLSVHDIRFKVYGPEEKKVYLFVNENTEKSPIDGISQGKLVDYDFDTLVPGSEFPTETLSELLITLNSRSDEVIDQEVPSSALPMSECHTVVMPAKDHHVDLYVTRAATKFTYIFNNESNVDLNLDQLTISKASRKEYYIPQVEYSEGSDPFNNNYTLDSYNVPNIDNNEYYEFVKSFASQSIPAATVTALSQSIYLLEGKYTDADGEKDSSGNPLNYSMSVTLNGTKYSSYFPDVKQLPRNTHVVVVVSFSNYGTQLEVDWTVDVYPYGEFWLEPGFGK